jgi:hypothetical protein
VTSLIGAAPAERVVGDAEKALEMCWLSLYFREDYCFDAH